MNAALQIESALRCPRCLGQGFVPTDAPAPRRDWFAGTVDVDCPACGGTGRAACDTCGDPAAVRYLGQSLCTPCAPAEDERFQACAICERPIDPSEARVPLCSSCEATARAAGEQAAEATRQLREQAA